MVDVNQLINALPEHIRKSYNMNDEDNIDFSKEKGMHTPDFDYYPGMSCVVIDGVIIYWEKDKPYIRPTNPAHLKALKQRIQARRHDSIGVIHKTKHNPENKLYCILQSKKDEISGMQKIAFDDSWIYYDNSEVNMTDELTQNIAKTLFAIQRYDAEFIIPKADKDPANWE